MIHGSGLTRRGALGTLGAGVLWARCPPAAATGSPAADRALRQVLDGLDHLPDATAKLAALDAIDPRGLSRSSWLDRETVHFALTTEMALAALPEGSDARYALQLQRACGAAIGPDQAEALLQAQAASLGARAQSLFATIGLQAAQAGDGYRALFADTRYHYGDDDAGRAEAVADMTRWLDRARASLPRWFAPLPAQCLDVRVAVLSAADIAANKPGYRILPAPGRQGCYFVDLRDIARRPRWSLRSVVHHELLPGHMIALPLEPRAHVHPLRLRHAAGFGEGWAIHAETLAWHGGLFADPVEELGIVHWLLFRAVRGLADIGIHHRGWHEDEALALMTRTLGCPAYFAPFAADIKAITARPGQRPAEALTARALSNGASRARDIRQFHQRILADGPVPLAFLDHGA